MNKISVSIMCADPYNFSKDLEILEEFNVDYLHIDIMDGHFVPNLGLGLDYINKFRKHTNIPFDYHLMIENPDKIIPKLDLREDDLVSIHFESSYRLEETLDIAKERNINLFLAMNPGTPVRILRSAPEWLAGINFMTVNPGFAGQQILPTSYKKMSRLRKYLKELGCPDLTIEVDGNMDLENIEVFKNLGANIFVLGTSSIYKNHQLNKDEIIKIKGMI